MTAIIDRQKTRTRQRHVTKGFNLIIVICP